MDTESLYAPHVDALMNRFSALVKHTQILVFPRILKGAAAPPDMTGWSRLRRLLFFISSPLPTIVMSGAVNSAYSALALSVWLVVSGFWYIAANVFLDRIFGTTHPSAPVPEESIWMQTVVYLIIALTLLLIPLAYWRWVEFLRDRRYSMNWRLILTVIFIIIALSFPYWGMLPEYRAQFPALLLENRIYLKMFAINYVLFLIPLGTFYYMVLLEFLVLAWQLYIMTIRYLASVHDPIPSRFIRKLALEPVPVDESGGGWSLVDLAPVELETLRGWAEASREGTEKRLLPTVVLFGILGMFANTRVFSDVLEKILVWVTGLFSIAPGRNNAPLSFLVSWLVFAFTALIVALFASGLLSLFRNLIVQALIIETCHVARYAQAMASVTTARKQQHSWWASVRRWWSSKP
jgi:hypothetical protein